MEIEWIDISLKTDYKIGNTYIIITSANDEICYPLANNFDDDLLELKISSPHLLVFSSNIFYITFYIPAPVMVYYHIDRSISYICCNNSNNIESIPRDHCTLGNIQCIGFNKGYTNFGLFPSDYTKIYTISNTYDVVILENKYLSNGGRKINHQYMGDRTIANFTYDGYFALLTEDLMLGVREYGHIIFDKFGKILKMWNYAPSIGDDLCAYNCSEKCCIISTGNCYELFSIEDHNNIHTIQKFRAKDFDGIIIKNNNVFLFRREDDHTINYVDVEENKIKYTKFNGDFTIGSIELNHTLRPRSEDVSNYKIKLFSLFDSYLIRHLFDIIFSYLEHPSVIHNFWQKKLLAKVNKNF